MPARHTPKEKANLALVSAMFDNVLNALNPEAASTYIAEDYIQHSQAAVSGLEPLRELLRHIREVNPQSVHDVKRMMADGDMVMVHYHARRWPGDDGWVAVDIYRIAGGLIVEHWDVTQNIDPKRVNPLPPY